MDGALNPPHDGCDGFFVPVNKDTEELAGDGADVAICTECGAGRAA